LGDAGAVQKPAQDQHGLDEQSRSGGPCAFRDGGVWPLADVEQGRASLGYWVVKSARGRGVAAGALRVARARGDAA